jgi:type I restriction enzyme S subunit
MYPDKLIQTRLSSSLTGPSFLEEALNCGASRRFVESKIRTTAGQSGVSGADIKSIPVPVCDVAEQVLIQEWLGSKLTKVAYLLDAIENALKRSEALRQCILDRAFSGKLVAQNPNDEPASILLERIKAEKAETENGKMKIKSRRMNTASIVSRVWSFCTTLRDDGVSYGDYLEQLTYLIFL